MACAHKTIADHSKPNKGGPRFWICSHCRNGGTWGPSWGYYGNHECLYCQTAQIDFVWCSEACRQALAEKHKIKPEAAPERKQKATRRKRVPSWQLQAEAMGWKPPSGGVA